MRLIRAACLIALAATIASCAANSLVVPEQAENAVVAPHVAMTPPQGFTPDLITPAGISVKTNGQYKTEAQRNAAAGAIDRYWSEVRKCADTSLESEGGDSNKREAEFPHALAIEIANNWTVVEGPTSHRRMQAFPSLAHPGSYSTARREKDSFYVVVVPELNGLGPQMVVELNNFLSAEGAAAPEDLLTSCSTIACVRFKYNNAPSQAWTDCVD
jgi:hypothetical protein